LVVQVSLPGKEFRWIASDFRTTCFSITLVLLAVQGLTCMTLFGLMRLKRPDEVNWEVISMILATILTMLVPWLNPWHASKIFGHSPAEVWGVATEEFEALRILAIVSITFAYYAYVPVRWRFSWILPCCSMASYLLLFALAGSPYPQSVPFKVLSLLFLLTVPMHRASTHEHLVRERWLARRLVDEQQDELDGMHAMCGILCNIVFKLTSTLNFVGKQGSRDSFFGCEVAGRRFTDYLASVDRIRFKDFVFRISDSMQPQSLPVTLVRGTIVEEANLFLVCTTSRGDDSVDADVQYLVGIKLTNEQNTRRSRGGTHLDDEVSMTNIVPVPHPMAMCTSLSRGSPEYASSAGAESGDIRNLHCGDIPEVPGIIPRSEQKTLESMSPNRSHRSQGVEAADGTGMPSRAEQGTLESMGPEMTFALSESTMGGGTRCNTGLLNIPSRGTLPALSHMQVSTATQTECMSLAMSSSTTTQTEEEGLSIMDCKKDQAVNTSIHWEEAGFKCLACARPPKLPGGPARPPPSQSRSRRRRRRAAEAQEENEQPDPESRQEEERYDGSDFDGAWVIKEEDAADAAQWLMCMYIRGCQVVLGDGDEVCLIKDGDGNTILCGGLLTIEDDQLLRRGKSGRVAVLNRVEDFSEAECLEIASGGGDASSDGDASDVCSDCESLISFVGGGEPEASVSRSSTEP